MSTYKTGTAARTEIRSVIPAKMEGDAMAEKKAINSQSAEKNITQEENEEKNPDRRLTPDRRMKPERRQGRARTRQQKLSETVTEGDQKTLEADGKELLEEISSKLRQYYGKPVKDATRKQLYNAIALTIKDRIMYKWAISTEDVENYKLKQLYYLSLEFLMGRALSNNILNFLKTDVYQEVCSYLDLSLDEIAEEENDAGLGNGGLGRLAACFMDSLSTLRLPATGCGIRYEYGLFKQKILDGYQIEMTDPWLEDGNVWETPSPDEKFEVRFGGTVYESWEDGAMKMIHENYETIYALPYDMPISGYNSNVVNKLRLWSAKSATQMDMTLFNSGDYLSASKDKQLAEVLSKVLYPEDNHQTGKTLRLKQQYFFVSATIQWILKDYKRVYGTNFFKMPDYIAIHINDTHPALAIPEMMRILIDCENLHWNEAWEIVSRIFSYTNHTIMSEAMECWQISFFKQNLPRIYSIVHEINETYCKQLWEKHPGAWDKIAHMAIIANDEVRMANLCIVMCRTVNGVSDLHTKILRKDVFREFCEEEPKKLVNVTNGVTHRRWLLHANPGLAGLIRETIGEDWILEPDQLKRLADYADDRVFQKRCEQIKMENKQRLADYILDTNGVMVDPQSIFDIQVKRLHEYKRQLLNVIHILHLYQRIKEDKSYRPYPRTFIFGAKASPGYYRAKMIIKLINSLAALIEADPDVRKYLQVVFIENYGVSLAEKIIPAADVSEQISTAGKEASGTGNMKFMLNGAVTIGTLDGANVEIEKLVGADNIYIFGMRAKEVSDLYNSGNYSSMHLYEIDEAINKAVNMIADGTLTPDKPRIFTDIYNSLLYNERGLADRYFVLRDFNSYKETHERLLTDYNNKSNWYHKTIINIASAGYFSSDRAIRDYNEMIWHLK